MDSMLIDIPEEELPGAGFNFQDVTNIFTEAATDMEPGSYLFMDDFSLLDAMSAFEIGEPRLDSGLMNKNESPRPFNPRTPLLPEEICWILDRSFAYQMLWHEGNLLSHTVFTILYGHRLAEIEVDFMPSSNPTKDDSLRPPELIYVVLRAFMMGLLKCCDLSWRELSKNGVQDAEDWQSEKCDISLLEGVPVRYVLSQLEEGGYWLLRTTKFPVLWRNALHARIILQKTILQLMHSSVFADSTQFEELLDLAHESLDIIRTHPSSEPQPDSAALLAFDPCISRRLKTFVPLRIIPLPSQSEMWLSIERMLMGWRELSRLSRTKTLSTWELVGQLRTWQPSQALQIPYLRSALQSTFYDGLLILNRYTYNWMVDRFFFETLGIPYESLVNTIRSNWTGSNPPPISRMERILYKLIVPHIRAQWLNPPRRRRHLVKSLVDWHLLYSNLVEIVARLDVTTLKNDAVMQMPNVALVWRLSAIREILFSGFQLELLASEERPIAYWYMSEILDTHLSCLDNMAPVVPTGSLAYSEIQFQRQLLTALQAMATALFVTSMPQISFAWDRIRPTFYRRYKWAFKPEYDRIQTPTVASPSLARLISACKAIFDEDFFSPADSVRSAEMILTALITSDSMGGWAGEWAKDRLQFLLNLIEACQRLAGLPKTAQDLGDFDMGRLKWDSRVHPWFPSV